MLIRVLTAPVPEHRRDSARTAEPVTFGVPLPRGLVTDPSNLAARSGSGAWRRTQARVLATWPDGSARWVLVDAQVDVAPGGHDGFEIETEGASLHGGPTVHAQPNGGGVAVDTGAAAFELHPGPSFPFRSVHVHAGQGEGAARAGLVDAAASRLVAIDRQGARHEAHIDRVEVETAGPLRAVVRMDGSLRLGGDRTLLITARAHFFAGLATTRIRITVTNSDRAVHAGGFWDLGDPASILLKDLGISFVLSAAAGGPEVTCSPEVGQAFEAAQLPFELYQDSSGGEHWRSANHINRERRVPVTFRGYRIRSGNTERQGLRATPIVHVRSGTGEMAAAVPQFWQNFPKAIEASANSLTVRLFPGQFADLHELQGGEQKTHECWLTFGGDRVSAEPLDWCRSPTLACVDPAWTLESGAVPQFASLDPDHAALVDAAIDGPDRFELKREVIDEFGWRHFGDVYGDHESVRQQDPPLVSHYNNQYDVLAGFILQYLRTADPRWWTMADALATHVADIDIYHTDRDKSAYNGGFFWHTYHYGEADTAGHRSYPRASQGHTHGGGPSADHNYTTGLALHHLLTGEPISRQTVIGLATYVIDLDDGRKTIFRWLDRGDTGWAARSAPDYYGPGRGPANSVTALIDGFRLSGDPRFLSKAEQLIRRVVHPRDDIARNNLDSPEDRWFYTMFLQALARYIEFKRERGDTDETYRYARASLLHYARWMAEHTYPYLTRPEKLVFPTETWAAQDIRKSDVFFAAARHASSEEERATFLERGEFFYRYSVDTLAGMSTRTLARPVAVLLTSGFMRSWTAREAPLSLEPAVDSFGSPATFVAQRRRAERRLKQLAGLFLVGVLGLLGWVVSH
jgi:hypothetical protein